MLLTAMDSTEQRNVNAFCPSNAFCFWVLGCFWFPSSVELLWYEPTNRCLVWNPKKGRHCTRWLFVLKLPWPLTPYIGLNKHISLLFIPNLPIRCLLSNAIHGALSQTNKKFSFSFLQTYHKIGTTCTKKFVPSLCHLEAAFSGTFSPPFAARSMHAPFEIQSIFPEARGRGESPPWTPNVKTQNNNLQLNHHELLKCFTPQTMCHWQSQAPTGKYIK